jgi:hypothetical protein
VSNKKIFPFLIFILTISFYIYTLAPSLAWGDGTKLQGDVIAGESFILAEMPPEQFDPDPYIFSKVGVAAWDHPLYIILGHLFVIAIPSVDSLWLVNFISAIFGAASVVLVFHFCFQYTKSLIASGYASLSLAVSHTFWWHSSSPEVYTMFTFLLLACIYFFEQLERSGKRSHLGYSAFFLGLAASNHLLAFLAFPALALYYYFSGTYKHLAAAPLGGIYIPVLGFLAGFMVYIVQFIRISRSIPLGEIMGPAIGSTFLSQLVKITPVSLGESLLTYLFFLAIQFGPIGIFLGAWGMGQIRRIKDVFPRKMVALFIVYAFFGILYTVTDQFAFFLSSYVFWAILMGIGSDSALHLLPQNRRFLPSAFVGLLIAATPFLYNALPRLAEVVGVNDVSMGIPQVGVGVRNGLAYYINPYKRGDYEAFEFGRQTVAGLPPNSIVIAEWYTDTDEYFVLRYFTRVKALRSDVSVLGWTTQDPFSFDSRLVSDVIEASFPGHPVYLSSLSDRFYSASRLVETYCIIPENNLYRLYPKTGNSLQCLTGVSVTE